MNILDKNYLGHDFKKYIWMPILNYLDDDYICKKCNIIIEFGYSTDYTYKQIFGKYTRLDCEFKLTCDEYLIKNIIE